MMHTVKCVFLGPSLPLKLLVVTAFAAFASNQVFAFIDTPRKQVHSVFHSLADRILDFNHDFNQETSQATLSRSHGSSEQELEASFSNAVRRHRALLLLWTRPRIYPRPWEDLCLAYFFWPRLTLCGMRISTVLNPHWGRMPSQSQTIAVA